MKITIVMGSASDLKIAQQVIDAIKLFDVDYNVRVISAHRTPDVIKELTNELKSQLGQVVIAIAGKAAHLAGVLAGSLTCPVIGVPVKSSSLEGLDALFSIVQMPKGVPVATVAIDGGFNAGLLAIQILSTNSEELTKKLVEYKKQLANETIEADKKLQEELSL